MGSFGKDENNSFYIFDLKTKSLYWEERTSYANENSLNEEQKENNEENENKKLNTDNLILNQEDNSEYLLEMCFNPSEYELCLVGVEKIMFANYKNQQLFEKANKPGRIRRIYTTCCYVNKEIIKESFMYTKTEKKFYQKK